MKVKILGGDCQRCRQVYDIFCRIAKEADADVSIIKVQDLTEILKYNVALMPAVVIDEVVKIAGYIPSEKEVGELLNIK